MKVSILIIILLQLFLPIAFIASHQDHSSQFNPPLWWFPREVNSNKTSDKLHDLLQRRGPNIRASADYHDFRDINIQESIEAWNFMRERASHFASKQVHFYKPKIMSLLKIANVSNICESAVNLTFDAIENLNSWSIKMWNSNGNFPPVGMFDGQLTDLGSYYGCLGAINRFDSSPIGYTSYCILSFRPVVPSRVMNEQVFNKLPDLLIKNFNETDLFYDMTQEAQYFHYFYIRMGVCVPHQCSSEDLQKVSILLGSENLYMMNGPVKCYTRAPPIEIKDEPPIKFGKIEDEPILVELYKPLNKYQIISIIVIGFFFSLVFLSSLWHAFEILTSNWFERKEVKLNASQSPNQATKVKNPNENVLFMKINQQPTNANDKNDKTILKVNEKSIQDTSYSLARCLAFDYFSIITNFKEFIRCDFISSNSEIKCLHGIRVLTMIWVICVHNLQYNQWDGFTRIYENVKVLQNLALHPIYNASYVVDNFFFMSGLLASYTVLLNAKRFINSKPSKPIDFNFCISLLSRYLRLTPQVLLISLLYILLPLFGEGPFWYDMTYYAAKTCEKNWWINLLHLQAFFGNGNEICNLVGWWISVDMFYYIIALILLTMILRSKTHDYKSALILTLLITVLFHGINAYKHFINGYTPNNLGTVPQVGYNWTGFVVDFFWSPYAHVVPFYLGFWCGYMLTHESVKNYVEQNYKKGWIISTITMIAINFSTHVWMSGLFELNNQFISTLYNSICPVGWSVSLAWIVFALHYNCAPTWINKLLSIKLFVMVSKASFIVYLSHMLLLRHYFGSQITLIEVSRVNLVFVVLGNTFNSILLGVLLCITFEGPCMKFQKLIIRKAKTIYNRNSDNSSESKEMNQVGQELLKSR